MNVTELEECIGLYGKDIYSFCRQLAYSRQAAEELYQDTFLKAMELLAHIDSKNNPKSYLLSITVRLWKNSKRKYAWRNRIAGMESLSQEGQQAEPDSGYSLEGEMLKKQEYRELREAVQNLEDKYRLPIYLHYMEELSVADIARVLKLPQGTVKSRLFQARKILKKELGPVLYPIRN